jgi:hypothetical protein
MLPPSEAPTIAGPWAVCVPWAKAASTLVLRLKPGLLAARDGDRIWLRGHDWSEGTTRLLRQLPVEAWYRVQPDGQLIRVDSRVPSGRLPALDWRPFETHWELRLPPASLPGRAGGRVALRLERTDDGRDADAILLDSPTWGRYAAIAPAVRLKPLSFAVCDDGRCLVRGRPVPPLPGLRLWESSAVLVPCGFTWEPAVDTAVVRQVLDVGDEDVVLWNADGSWERLPADQFVRATRSAARATFGGGS